MTYLLDQIKDEINASLNALGKGKMEYFAKSMLKQHKLSNF